VAPMREDRAGFLASNLRGLGVPVGGTLTALVYKLHTSVHSTQSHRPGSQVKVASDGDLFTRIMRAMRAMIALTTS
jgi:hypothetical protein